MSALATSAPSGSRTGEVQDAELVRRVRGGDESAFEALYHRYHRRITAYIYGMVHDHARAEDVAQDVFVSALRRMRDTDRPIAFKPWIYEIAKNACIDQFRRSRRAEEVSYDGEEGLGAADYGRLVSSDAMPEHELESKTNLDHLCGAFGGLSETHHEILVMRELEGLSYREIGDRLGMSRPSVESTLFRARRRLTEEYEELVSGARCQRIQAIIAEASASDLGARDQRRLARHVSHCQPCRRQARLAGLEIAVTADQPVRVRIAAFLPLPLFLRRRWLGDGDVQASGAGSSHLTGFAQWSAQLGSTVDPSWLKAAATAATIAVAGIGASAATHTVTASSPAGDLGQVVSGLSGSSSASPSGGAAASAVAAGAASATQRDGAAASSAGGGQNAAAGGGAGATGHGGASATTAPGAGSAQAAAPVDQAASGAGDLANGAQQKAAGAGSGVSPPAPPDASAPGTPSVSAPHADVPASTPATPAAPAPTPPAPPAAPDAGGAADTASGATGALPGTVTTAVGGGLSGH